MEANTLSRGGVVALIVACAVAFGLVSHSVSAANTPTFNQQINAGTLSSDIKDGTRTPVASPSVSMTAKNFSDTCQDGVNASTGTFGTATERAYVTNPSGANSGWTLSLAATGGPTALWTSGANTYDFNDATTAGCTDGIDTDTKAGQLTIDPSVGAITTDCVSCGMTGITKGSQAGFVEGGPDNITLISAGSTSDDVWQGYITGVGLSQTIPAETAAGTYTLNLTLTAVAL